MDRKKIFFTIVLLIICKVIIIELYNHNIYENTFKFKFKLKYFYCYVKILWIKYKNNWIKILFNSLI
jgi:hypothetical protein